MIPIPVNESLIQRDTEGKTKKLCKEIACVIGPLTCTCTIFILWFFHEVNVEFNNSTDY